MEVNAVQANIEEVARRWSAERATRQNRRNLDPADFAELAKAGHLNEQGRPYNPKSVLALINGPRPKSDA